MASQTEIRSWFDADRRNPPSSLNEYPHNLIARIYFKTNDRQLGEDDLEVVSKVATLVRHELLLGRQVELALIGSADVRGTAAYNQWLSEQRVKAVAERLGRLLHDRTDFCCLLAAGLGETQSSHDRSSMDYDRGVNVWWKPPQSRLASRLRRYRPGTGYLPDSSPDVSPRRRAPAALPDWQPRRPG